MFEMFCNQVFLMLHTLLPHTSCSTIRSFMTSSSTTKILTLQFQYLPHIFQQPKKSTNSASMPDIQMLHFLSALLQELTSGRPSLQSTGFQFFQLPADAMTCFPLEAPSSRALPVCPVLIVYGGHKYLLKASYKCL